MNSFKTWIALAAVALLLTACGGGNSSPAPSPVAYTPVTSVANTAPAPVTSAPVTVAPTAPAPAPSSPAPAPSAPAVAIVPRKPGTSNAPPGYPTHSDSGYPLFYGIGGDGKPVGAARLYFDGQTFANTAEIDDYSVGKARREAALDFFDANVDTRGIGFPDWTVEETDAALAEFDARLAFGEAQAFYQISAAEQFGLQNRGWSRQSVALKVNQYNSGAKPY